MRPEHTDRKFDEDLKSLRDMLIRMGGLIEDQIEQSINSLVNRDATLAEAVIDRDKEVNRMDANVDDFCIRLLALHQPAAKDLRFIMTALKITTDLERVGDIAVNICERSLELMREAPLKPYIDIPRMAGIAEKMIRDSLNAFIREDTSLALQVCTADEEIDDLNEQIFRETVSYMIAEPKTINRAMKISFVSKYLERIADHATNIAEMVVYMVKGKSIRHVQEVPPTV
jgi:phosphate transport system protein